MMTESKSSPPRRAAVLTLASLLGTLLWLAAGAAYVYAVEPLPESLFPTSASASEASVIDGAEIPYEGFTLHIYDSEGRETVGGEALQSGGIVSGGSPVEELSLERTMLQFTQSRDINTPLLAMRLPQSQEPDSVTPTRGIRIRDVDPSENPPIVIVDGAEIPYEKFNLTPDNIGTFELLPNEEAIKKYGERAKGGVVIITTRKESDPPPAPAFVVGE